MRPAGSASLPLLSLPFVEVIGLFADNLRLVVHDRRDLPSTSRVRHVAPFVTNYAFWDLFGAYILLAGRK